MKYILILGASQDQLFIIKTAQNMGIGTVVVDANKDAPGLNIADYSATIDFSNISAVLSFIDDLQNNGVDVCGVSTMGSDVPHIVSEISNHFHWIGPSTSTAELATNKYYMKKHLQSADIPVPRYSIVKNKGDILQRWNEWKCKKIIIKPTDRAGSRGVHLLSFRDDIEKAFANSYSNSLINQVIAEEYIDGLQISTESILFDGLVETPGFADREYVGMDSFYPQVMENGGWVPTNLCNDTEETVKQLVEDAAKIMGIHSGVAKGDVVIDSQKGPMIIEIAARLSGGDFCESLVPIGTGVNYVEEVIRIAIGQKPLWDKLMPRFNQTVANRYFFPPPGVLQDIRGVNIVSHLAGIKKVLMYNQVGDTIPRITSHGQRAGVFIIAARNRNSVQEIIDHVYENVEFKIDGKWYNGHPTNYMV